MKAYELSFMRLLRFGRSVMLMNMQEDGYVSDEDVYEDIVNGHCSIRQADKAVLVLEEPLQKGMSWKDCSWIPKEKIVGDELI